MEHSVDLSIIIGDTSIDHLVGLSLRVLKVEAIIPS